MLTKRIIPCLDVRDGRVVKGVRFQGLRDSGDPAELAARYEDQGADELTLLDVSATIEARRAAIDTVARVRRALSIPLTVGGGVRSADDASRLLDAGADKVGVNSAAVDDPELIARCAERFGAQCVVLAIDAARTGATTSAPPAWRVVTRSGSTRTDLDAVAWASRGAALGAGEILLTSWDRDGTRSGYDLELVRAVASAVGVPVIASGGAAGPDDLSSALRNGADAALAAGIFHEGLVTIEEVKLAAARAGLPMRRAEAIA
jgi:imidazoleglycerol phosphate synthase cyclase subunit